MGAPVFHFKQFSVEHDKCAMKVGTDGVLLGAWSPLPSTSSCARVLDIGIGSGLIALMIAQRLRQEAQEFTIYGIDIDPDAVKQSLINFQQSPWAGHLTSQHCTLQQYQVDEPFDLIVSNPPYFQNSLKNPNNARATARHTDSLPYNELLDHASRLLGQNGILALILPAEAEKEILLLAQEHHLSPTHITYVHSKPGKSAKRILLAFTKTTTYVPFITEHFYVESENSPRSEEYQQLTQEFYL